MTHIYASKYKTKRDGFEVLMKKNQFTKTLFIFNDNEREHDSCKRGSGNAVIRKYNVYSSLEYPKSHGIPTGVYRKGYSELNEECMTAIDNAISEIKELLSTGYYDSIMYSMEDDQDIVLGTGIFTVSRDVLVYITKQIFSLGDKIFIVRDGSVDLDEYVDIDIDVIESIE